MNRRGTIAVVMLLLFAGYPAMVICFTPGTDALPVNTFGTGDGNATALIGPGGGINDTVTIKVPRNTRALSAVMNVRAGPYTPGGTDRFDLTTVDIGVDGRTEWGWGGQPNGTLGRQTLFSGGTDNVSYFFNAAGSNSNTKVRLPKDAQIRNATLSVSGGTNEYFNEVTKTGGVDERLGYCTASLGDVNGDGIIDYAVGSNCYVGSGKVGHVYIYFGNATPKSTPDVTLTASQQYDHYGTAVAGKTDVNGDGLMDVIVGAFDYDLGSYCATGAAFIYYGGRTINSTPDITLAGYSDGDYFGYSVAGIGDVNGDGFGDVAIGAPYNSSISSWTGAAYVYFGGRPMNTVPDITLSGVDGDGVGTCVGSAGDLNNDAFPDFFFGSPDWGQVGYGCGGVFVYFGGSSVDSTPDLNLTPIDSSSLGDHASCAGDLNGDGYDDLAVQNNWGEVWIYHGGRPMDSNVDLKIIGPSYSGFGSAIDTLGDLNGDGFDDIIVGAYSYDRAAADTDEGKVFIYLGGAPMDTTEDYTFASEGEGYRFGISVTGLGDINSDGFRDFVMGADMRFNYTSMTGKWYLKMCARGIFSPSVKFEGTGALLWNITGYYSGSSSAGELGARCQAALAAASVSFTDRFGNRFSDVVLNVSSLARGDLRLYGLEISYDLTLAIPDFSAAINDFTRNHTAGPDSFVSIPVRVWSPCAGRLIFSGLTMLLDEAPRRNIAAVVNLSIAEGTKNNTLLDLRTVFSDDFTSSDNLTYILGENTNSSYITVSVTQTGHLSADAVTDTLDPNWTGKSSIPVLARDGRGLVSDPVFLTVNVKNTEDAPVITSQPSSTAAMEGRKYIYSITAVDGDTGDTLSYRLVSGPANLTVNPATGLVEWVPVLEQVGSNRVAVAATDGKSDATQEFTVTVSIRVSTGNNLPVVLSDPVTNADVGVMYTYQILVSDQDQLVYTLVKGPSGLELDRTTGKLTMTPAMSDVGSHNITVNVSDGKDRIFHSYILVISGTNPNHPPEIAAAPPDIAFAGMEYLFQFQATDFDGDKPFFTLGGSPAGMRLALTGQLTWVPAATQIGAWTFSITVSDGKIYVTRTYTVDVVINHPPVFNTTPSYSVRAGNEYVYNITVYDSDARDTPALVFLRGPDGMTFNNTTGSLRWTPRKDQLGHSPVSLRGWDGKEGTFQNFTIDVTKAPVVPVVSNQNNLILPMLLVALIGAVGGIGGYIYLQKRRKAAVEASLVIDDVFLVYRDGRLMTHHTRRLKPETDGEILTSMLTAIQDFVKQSIPTEGEVQKPIQNIDFGPNSILIQHGKNIYIAAVVQGGEHSVFGARMKQVVDDIEAIHGSVLEHWTGELTGLDDVKRNVKSLLRATEGGAGAERYHKETPPGQDGTAIKGDDETIKPAEKAASGEENAADKPLAAPPGEPVLIGEIDTNAESEGDDE